MKRLALTTLLALSSFGAFLTAAQAHDHDHDRRHSSCYPYYPCYENWYDDDDYYPFYESHHRHHHHDHP